MRDLQSDVINELYEMYPEAEKEDTLAKTLSILIIELKWNKNAIKNEEGAISRIKSRNYPQLLEGFGSEILLVGISYDEKTKKHSCAIEKHIR